MTGKQEVGIYERLEKNMYKEIGVNKKMCAEISINNQIVLFWDSFYFVFDDC